MSENKINIDPNEFAMSLIKAINKSDNMTNERFIKNQLTLYLEAYVMIDDFNHLEVDQIKNMEKQQISELFDKMLSGRFTP
ncbi:hypothetical protein [Leuconostoc miyukkimchii]|uniref:hypothetical protein n=1 Tax=Leuconostoc miyukkimchii TaxID=910540 RepID=UPI001C7DA00F|nr:hypothetical protein [Leuconostoc miyukkimchii]